MFFDREAKQHGPIKCFETAVPGIGKIKSAKVNCSGSKVCVTCEKVGSLDGTHLTINCLKKKGVSDMETNYVGLFTYDPYKLVALTETRRIIH
jgi:hypothetical protein